MLFYKYIDSLTGPKPVIQPEYQPWCWIRVKKTHYLSVIPDIGIIECDHIEIIGCDHIERKDQVTALLA